MNSSMAANGTAAPDRSPCAGSGGAAGIQGTKRESIESRALATLESSGWRTPTDACNLVDDSSVPSAPGERKQPAFQVLRVLQVEASVDLLDADDSSECTDMGR